MSWVTIIWSMIASACLTLALAQGMVWCWRREAWSNLFFALAGLGAAFYAGCELWMMRAQTPEEFGVAMRWAHVPVWVLVLSLVGFARLHLRAGRSWLAWSVCGLRTLALILDFVFRPSLNYREIIALRQVPFLGESVSVAEGSPNPWMLVGQLSLVLLVIYFADATMVVWRRGDRRLATIGGSIVFFTLAGLGQAVLFLWGIVPAPLAISPFYLAIVLVMAFESSLDLLRSSELSESLRESEQRMSLAVEAAQLGIWFGNPERKEMWATDKWRALFGFTESERLETDSHWQRLHPEDREAVQLARTKAIEGDGHYEMDHRVVLPDGKIRWMASHGRVEYNSAGKAVIVRGVCRDITVRKLAEEALRESEARFRILANSAPVMIWMSGTDKLCTFFNQGWLDFTGRTQEQELGNGWAEGVHREDFDRCLEVYQSAFDARERFEMEYRLRRSDAEYRWVLDVGTPRYSTDGSFLGYIGSCLDISARKLAEEAAHDLSGRLIHAQEETLTRFARELHDDLSQNLALLSVELEMFAQNPPLDPVKISARMEQFSAQVKGLSADVHQLSHELHPAKLEQLGLEAAMRGFCKEFARTYEMAVEFAERDVPRAIPNDTALCLYRIAQEALHNVVKHSGGSAAKVSLTREDGQIRLVVADDGAGFDPHAVRDSGSLGLIGMGERARFVGGRLAIKSHPGGGTRIEVCVPIAESTPQSPRPVHIKEPALP